MQHSRRDMVLVTRPGQRGRDLVASINALGLDTHLLELIKIVYFTPPRVNWVSYQKIIVTSAHALSAWPKNAKAEASCCNTIQWFAIGSATQSALHSAFGVTAYSPDQRNENSEGLLELRDLKAVSGEHILILKGKGGRSLIAETLEERGAQVSSLDLYERKAQNLSGPALEWLNSSNNALIIVTSLEIAKLLLSLLKPLTNSQQQFRFLTSSARIEGELTQAGFTASICENASNQSIFDWIQAHFA